MIIHENINQVVVAELIYCDIGLSYVWGKEMPGELGPEIVGRAIFLSCDRSFWCINIFTSSIAFLHDFWL